MSKVKIVGIISPLMQRIRSHHRHADVAVAEIKAGAVGGYGPERSGSVADHHRLAAHKDLGALLDHMGAPARPTDRQLKRLAKHLRRNGKLCPWWTVYHQRLAVRECGWIREKEAGRKAGRLAK